MACQRKFTSVAPVGHRKKEIVNRAKPIDSNCMETYVVKCKNKFAPLQNYSEETIDMCINSHNERGGKTNVKGNLGVKSDKHGKHSITNRRVFDVDNVLKARGNSVSTCKNKGISQIDYTDTDFIVKSALDRKNYIKKVIPENLNNKCSDLKKCLSQQNNAYGFIPISNLNKARFASSARPNKILHKGNFDPIAVHHEV